CATLLHSCLFLIFCTAFFFYLYAAHLDLHSFPTRRSSDLPRRWLSIAEPKFLWWPNISLPGDRMLHRQVIERQLWAAATSCRRRSEEHTSELQSPDHLVCRLLLEKKNKTKFKGL